MSCATCWAPRMNSPLRRRANPGASLFANAGPVGPTGPVALDRVEILGVALSLF